MADPQGVWSIDASEFSEKGAHAVGVAPPYCGALGKTANCPSGMFLCYASPKGYTLLDARLYLPQCWFTDADAQRREDCRVPQGLKFQTKPELALELGRALWATQLLSRATLLRGRTSASSGRRRRRACASVSV